MNDRIKGHQTTAEDVLEWLFENSTGTIAEFEEAQFAEESIYEWLAAQESPPRVDPENQVWEWLTGRGEDTWTRPGREVRGDEQARIAEALDSLRNLLEDQITESLGVTVILDQPTESGDKFQVVGGDSSYTKILSTSDAEALVAGEKILRFKIKPDKKGYKLIHHRSKGAKRTIFLDAHPGHDRGRHDPQTAESSYARLDSQIPKKLPDCYGTERDVDKDLVQASPVLVDLIVEDPEL